MDQQGREFWGEFHPLLVGKAHGLNRSFCGLYHGHSLVYADDLRGRLAWIFHWCTEFLHLWVWLLAYELVGVPFGYHKLKGGLSSDFVGFHLRYDLCEVGITEKRGKWLREWILKVAASKFGVQTKEFCGVLGEVGLCRSTAYLDEGTPFTTLLLGGCDFFGHCGEATRNCDPFFEVLTERVVS